MATDEATLAMLFISAETEREGGRNSSYVSYFRLCLKMSMMKSKTKTTKIMCVCVCVYKMRLAHSSIFAWSIAWTEEPGGLQSMGLKRVVRD